MDQTGAQTFKLAQVKARSEVSAANEKKENENGGKSENSSSSAIGALKRTDLEWEKEWRNFVTL